MKLVINSCYGGFGLSMAAVRRLAELKGRPCFFFESRINKPYRPITEGEKVFMWAAFDIPNPNDILPSCENWSALTVEQRQAHNEAWESHAISLRPDDRSDPDLVRVVEELGAAANGNHAALEVVEIPDGVEWEVEEYDGSEWIAEKHRTWGR